MKIYVLSIGYEHEAIAVFDSVERAMQGANDYAEVRMEFRKGLHPNTWTTGYPGFRIEEFTLNEVSPA